MSTDGRAKPPLLALLICEQALLDEDKAASLIRIVDMFNFDIVTGAQPLQGVLERAAVQIKCNVFTRWGPGEGEFTEELRVVLPNGDEHPKKSVMKLKKPPGFHFHQVRRRINLRGGLVCLNSAARFDKWNRAAVR